MEIIQRARQSDLMVVVSRRLLYVGMFLLPMLRFHIEGALNLSDGFFAAGAVVLALSAKPPARAPKTPGWFFGVWVVVLAGLLACYQADSAFGSVQVVFNGIFVLVVWQWECRQLLDTTARIERAMAGFIIGTAVSAFVAFLQTYAHLTILGQGTGYGEEGARAVGLGNQPNIAGITYSLAVVLAGALILRHGVRARWYLGLSLLMMVAALIFTASVSGMAATLLGGIILFVRRGVPLRRIVATLIVLGVVYAVAVSVQSSKTGYSLNPISRIEQTTGNNTGYNTVSPREDTIINAWGGIEKSPIIGHGLDQETLATYLDPYVGPYPGTFYPPHDLWVLLWYGGGIFMVFGYLIIFGAGFKRVLLQKGDPLADAVLAGMIAVLFFSLQSPELFDRWLWLPFILAMCVHPTVTAPQRRRGLVRRAPAEPSAALS